MKTLTKDDLTAAQKESINTIGLAMEYHAAFDHATDRHKNLPMHGHTFLEMNYIINGRCEHLFEDGQVYLDGAGAMGIVHYNEAHVVRTPFGPVEKMNLFLDLDRFLLPTLPTALRQHLPTILPLHAALKDRRNRVTHLQFQNHQKITHLLLALNEEWQHRPAGYRDAIDSYFRLFLLEACRTVAAGGVKRSEFPKSNVTARIENVLEHINRHFMENLSLQQLAKMGHMNQSYFCRKFKQHTGQTPVSYILHRKIERAMLLLRNDEAKVMEVCFESGFNDVSFFTRTFKRISGVTPSQYRRQH